MIYNGLDQNWDQEKSKELATQGQRRKAAPFDVAGPRRLAPPFLAMTGAHHRDQKEAFLLHEKSFFLVLTTGKFFNKVNQAESLDFSLALGGSSGLIGGERNP